MGDDREEDESPSGPHPSIIPKNTDANVKIEELRKRLQDRIANMKNQRLPTKKKPIERPQPAKKTPASEGAKKAPQGNPIETLKHQLAFNEDDDDHSAASSISMNQNNDNDEPDIEFGHVVNEEKQLRTQPIKRDGGKVQRIKKLLQEAERKRERMRALAASKDEVEQRKVKSEQWQDVLKSAAGEKTIMVDPTAQGLSRAETRMKKALKRHEKKKQKSAEEWNARLDKVKEDIDAKQQKREDNIKARKLSKQGDAPPVNTDKEKEKKKAVPIGRPGVQQVDKKKTQKAEQNGKNRAGFEGKKASFLNANK